MSEHQVDVALNQQQRELLDNTLARFPGETRQDVLLRALREYSADHLSDR